MADRDVLARAVRERRVLLTFDKDFGELAFRSGLPANCGVVLFRVPPSPDVVTSLAMRALDSGRCEGRFIVVEPGQTRERDLPERQA